MAIRNILQNMTLVLVCGCLSTFTTDEVFAKEADTLMTADSSLAAGFVFIGRRGDISIFEKKANLNNSVSLAFETETTASIDDLVLAVTDYSHQIGVMKHVGEIRILACTPYEMLVYQRLRLPVISDRDYTIRVRLLSENGTVIVTYMAISAEEIVPLRNGVVRLTKHEGSWRFIPQPNGHVRVVYTASLDLAGWVPRWLVRPGMLDEFPIVWKNIRQMLTLVSKEKHPCLLQPSN